LRITFYNSAALKKAESLFERGKQIGLMSGAVKNSPSDLQCIRSSGERYQTFVGSSFRRRKTKKKAGSVNGEKEGNEKGTNGR
jgi:hypothetical protein